MFSIFPGRWRAELQTEREALRALAAHGRLVLAGVTGPSSMTRIAQAVVDRCLGALSAASRCEDVPDGPKTLELVREAHKQLWKGLEELSVAAFAHSHQPEFVVTGATWETSIQAAIDALGSSPLQG